MTNWELLWWLLPMRLVGGLFRRHVLKRVPWEVEKNLIRLAGDWARAVDAAVADLAETWRLPDYPHLAPSPPLVAKRRWLRTPAGSRVTCRVPRLSLAEFE
jgi:hypothetical protein